MHHLGSRGLQREGSSRAKAPGRGQSTRESVWQRDRKRGFGMLYAFGYSQMLARERKLVHLLRYSPCEAEPVIC